MHTSGLRATADVGLMCRNDFKLSAGASSVCASIADFATPPLVRDLFEKASLNEMFAGIEANAAKVGCACCLCRPSFCVSVAFPLT